MATAQREQDDTLAVVGVLAAVLWLGPLAVACALLALRSAARAGRSRPRYAALALVLGLVGTVAWVGYLVAPTAPLAARSASASTSADVVAYAALPGVAELAPAAARDAGTARGDAEPEGAPLADQSSALLGALPTQAGGYLSVGFEPTQTPGALEAYRAHFVEPSGDDVVVTVARWGTTDEAGAHVAVAGREAADRAGVPLRGTRVVAGASRVVADGAATYLWADFTTTVEVAGDRRGARAVAAGIAPERS